MIIGSAIGSFPDGGGGGPASVASPFDVLASNPETIPLYLLLASPYDPGSAGITNVYYSTGAFTSDPSDTPPSQVFEENRIASPIDLSNTLSLQRGRLVATGTTAGDVLLTTEKDGDRIDELAGYLWDGRDAQVLIGFDGYTLAQCSEVFVGTAEGAAWNKDVIRVRLRSARFRLERPIQTNLYVGTGGVEGGDEIKGKPKPLCYGPKRQLPPVLVDGTNLVYQAHDGTVDAISAVRDRGVPLAFDADYASYAALIGSGTIGSGEYGTCLAEGLIRLGASPAGIVTTDVRGDKSGTLGASGYTSTAADIVRKIATTKGDLTDPDDLEVGTFTDLNAAQSSAVGVFIGLETRKISEVVDEVAASVGAFIDFTRTGRLAITRMIDPSTSTSTATITSIRQESFVGQDADIPAHTVKLRYRRYPATLSGEEAATSLDDDTRLDYGQEFRDTTAADASILTLHPSAEIYEVPTLIDTSGDAETEAARLLALYKPSRHRYEVEAWNGLYRYRLGDVVTLQVPRYDLASGKKFVVIGIRETPFSRAPEVPHENVVMLTLWGREN